MHEQLARIYHLALRLWALQLWHAPVCAFGAALLLRWLGPTSAPRAAGLAILAGWLVMVLPANPVTAATPVARLPGAALLLLVFVKSRAPAGTIPPWLALPLYAAAAAWWLRGTPFDGPAIANLVPVFLGLIAAAAAARRLATKDPGTTTIAAAFALAAALAVAHAGPHWPRAALACAGAGLGLLGLTEIAAPLAQAVILVATSAVVASNRGRLVPVDLAAAAPFAVWLLAPRMLPRLKSAGPAMAGAVTAIGCVALIWAVIALFALR
jgi:hypothetical protein